MTRTLLLVLAALTAVPAAPAAAGHTQQECGFQAFSQATVTAGRYTGEAEGRILGAVGETVSIRCEIRVNGVVADATATQSGTTLAVTAGVVRYAATDTDLVELCTVVTHSHGGEESCLPAVSPDGTPPL